jgi:aryl-alcohol dehydrogenase-like predicted oxidoreductase
METIRLGSSALEVSRVGLGCNNFGRRLDREGTQAVVDAALAAGIAFLDTADAYGDRGGSERLLGEVLEGRRDAVVLATKFGLDMGGVNGDGPRGGRDYLRRAVAGSLERLRTDRIDLLYYHAPDGVTPIEETVAAMHELLEEGTVGAIGISNVDESQLRRAVAAAPVAAVQNEYSLLWRAPEADVLPACRELGVGFVPYFPLRLGLLTGKYRRGRPLPSGTRLSGREDLFTDESLDRVEALARFAEDQGRSLLELAIAGLASEPGVASVIAGAMTPEQVRENAAAGEWRLDAAQRDALRAVA